MMDESSKLLLTVAIPTITVLIGILLNNRQLDQQQRHMDQLFHSLRGELGALRTEVYSSVKRVEEVMDARLRLVEEILKIR